MTNELRGYLREQFIGAAVVNLLLNGLIASALFRHLAVVPQWGEESIAGDTVATSFLLPLITCLIVTALARREVRHGRFPGLTWQRAAHPLLAYLPSGTFLRGIVFGALCVALCALPTLALLSAGAVDSLRFWPFILFKAGYAGALGALVTPLIALCAVGDQTPRPAVAATT